MGQLPSSLQIVYTKQVSNTVLADIIKNIHEVEQVVKRALTGGSGSSQLDTLPDDIVYSIAADTAQSLRVAILAYYKSIGLYPE